MVDQAALSKAISKYNKAAVKRRLKKVADLKKSRGTITEQKKVQVVYVGHPEIKDTKTVNVVSSGSGSSSSKPKDQYFLNIGEKKVQVSEALYNKVNADNARASTQKDAPLVTLTSRGAQYTDTKRLVSDVRTEQDKANAFEYLAPAEKFLAERFGSKEQVYEKIVTTKQRLARESDYFGQQAAKYWKIDSSGSQIGSGEYFKSIPYRSKELFSEFKSGAFNMITAPVETAALITISKSLPQAKAGDAYAGTGSAGMFGYSTIYATTRDPDAAKGVARTAGEASVILTGVKTANKVQNTFKEIVLRNDLKVVGQGGATRSYTSNKGETIAETRSASRVVGKKTDLTIKSTINQKISPQTENINIGKGQGSFKVIESKSGKITGTGKIDSRSIYNTADQRSLSLIKSSTNKGTSKYIDYTRYKTNPDAVTTEMSSLFKTKSFNTKTLGNAKPIELSKTVSQEVFQRGIYTESGSLLGTESRSIFLKGGVQRQSGISKFFKFDIYKAPKVNPIQSGSGSSVTTQSTQASSVLSVQQGLAKEIAIKNIITSETSSKIIPNLFNQKTKTVVTTSQGNPKPTTIQTSKIQETKPIQKIKPIVSYKQVQKEISIQKETQKPIQRQSFNTIQTQKPIQKITPIVDVFPIQRQKTETVSVPIRTAPLKTKTVVTTFPKPTPSYNFTTIIPTIPTGFEIGKISMPFTEFGNKQKPSKQVKFKTKYTPSLEADIFNLRGRESKFAALSGLGTRYITKSGGI